MLDTAQALIPTTRRYVVYTTRAKFIAALKRHAPKLLTEMEEKIPSAKWGGDVTLAFQHTAPGRLEIIEAVVLLRSSGHGNKDTTVVPPDAVVKALVLPEAMAAMLADAERWQAKLRREQVRMLILKENGR